MKASTVTISLLHPSHGIVCTNKSGCLNAPYLSLERGMENDVVVTSGLLVENDDSSKPYTNITKSEACSRSF